MNFLKRTLHSLWYYGRNTLLLFIVFLALAVLILSGYSMLAACGQEEQSLRESVERMAAQEQVSGYNPYSYSLVRKTEDIKPVVTPEQEQMSPGGEDTWLRVEGTGELGAAAEFVSGTYELLEGRLFKPDDSFSAMVKRRCPGKRNSDRRYSPFRGLLYSA